MRALSIAILSIAGVVSAADLSDDLWFVADFDRPATINGEMLEQSVPDDALVEGRYGKACFFRRQAKNVLLPTADFLTATNSFEGIGRSKLVADVKAGTLSFAGGEMRFLPQPTGQPNSWSTKVVSTTFAMEVKGKKGDELVLTPEITELSDKDIKAIQKSDKGFSPTTCLPNVATPRTFRLTGDWQRVWNVATYDIRTRYVRRVGWRVKAGKPVKMRKFLQQPTGYSHYGNIVEPTEWVEGNSNRGEFYLLVRDRRLLADFPFANGTFSCWLRTPEGWCPPDRILPGFQYRAGGAPEWGFFGNAFSTAKGYGKAYTGLGMFVGRTNEWTHFAATWKPDEFCAYVNGRQIARVENPPLMDMRELENAFLRIGGDQSMGSADAVMDDVAIFRRALSSAEVEKLATASAGLLDGARKYFSAPPDFTAFPRNHPNAAIRFAVDSPRNATLAIEAEIGGVKLSPREVALKKGANTVACPFRAADWRCGKYGWKVSLVDRGAAVVRHSGTLTIVPAPDRGGFRVMSCADTDKSTLDLFETLGFNTISVRYFTPKNVNPCEERGFRVDLFFENDKEWMTENFDLKRIREKAVKQMRPFAGDPMWSSTLVNSEVYGVGWAPRAASMSKWREFAKRQLGHEPVVAFSSAPCGVNWGKVGLKNPRGVLPQTDVYDTLEWYMRRGMPQLLMTRIGAKVAHELSPGNVVWSEPSPSLESLDMSADWIYSYDPFACLAFLRYYAGWPRGCGKLFMPLLSMGYWTPDFMEHLTPHPTQKDPKTGKPVSVMPLQTCDELRIKSIMCIAGSAVDSISYFSACWCWGQGVTNGVLHEKGQPLAYCPGWQKYCLAEKDAPERFGAFMRETFMPAAMLLRNVPNERAPVALLHPQEIGYSGEFWWPRVNYIRQLGRALSRQKIPYDVLFDPEFTVETLSKYRYVFYPQLNVITPEHDKVMKAMPTTTTFLHDENTFVAKQLLNYQNFELVNGLRQEFPAKEKNLEEPLEAWYGPRVDELRARLSAWSDEDGVGAWTFAKEEYKGVRYVAVVNNARRKGGCPQTDICTNATYRPIGAPQRITTHFAKLGGTVVYEFNPADGKHNPKIQNNQATIDYAAASSRVFCLYPKKLAAPKLELSGGLAAGRDAELVVRIADVDGKPAPGRQVVRLTIADPDGRVMDESGLYTVEDGQAKVVLRFSRTDKPGGVLSKWKASVTDLTTGMTETMHFRLR